MKTDKFNYCIGFRWNNEDSNSAVGLYAYGNFNWHGTLKSAQEMLEFIRDREDGEHIYRIYKLEEVL